MTEEIEKNILRRKVGAVRPVREGAPITPMRTLGQALAHAGQELMGLPIRAAEAREKRMSLADLPEALPEKALLAVIEGPGESLGLIALSPTLLATLIEMQTTGRISSGDPAPRKPTRTDATMSADFIDETLGKVEETMAAHADITWMGGYRYASFLDDPRPLGLLLEDVGYRVFDCRLELGAAANRQGNFIIALPAVGRGAGPRVTAEGEETTPRDAAQIQAEWQDQMERTLLTTQVALGATLHRVSLPLSAVLGFEAGTVLPVPMAALENLTLEGAGGRVVAHGRLGQHRGFCAVRLTRLGNEEAAPDLQADDSGAAAAMGLGFSGAAPADDIPLASDAMGLVGLGDAGAEDGALPMADFGQPMEETGELGGLGGLGELGGLGGLGEEEGELPPLDIGSVA